MGPPAPTGSPVDRGPVALGKQLAVLAVDPGGTTGVAAAYFETRGTLRETLETMTRRKSVEVTGYWHDQVQELAQLWSRFEFSANVEGGIPLGDVHVVFENYLPDPRRIGAGATDLSPVWVAAGVCGAMGREPTWQTPSEAKGFARDDRLRSWGLWERGSAHKRDAWRHVVTRLNRLV